MNRQGLPTVHGLNNGTRIVNSPLKISLLIAGLVAVLAGLAWVGTFFYWHVRLTTALRHWEAEANRWNLRWRWRTSGLAPEGFRTTEEAGCRALPYLVRSLERDSKPEFLEGVADRITQILAGPIPRNPPQVRTYTQRQEAWVPERGDAPALRAAKRKRLQAWWRAHGDECHRWWRVWSARCDDCSISEQCALD